MTDEDNGNGRKASNFLDVDALAASVGASSASPLTGKSVHSELLQQLENDRKKYESLLKTSALSNTLQAQFDKQRKLLDDVMGRVSVSSGPKGATFADAMMSSALPKSIEVQPMRIPPMPRNPALDTNIRLEEISERFDTMLEVMGNAAEIATTIQEQASGFIGKFEEASKSTDQSARKAILVGLIALGISVLSPFAPLAIEYFSPDTVVPAIEAMRDDFVEAASAERKVTQDGLEALRNAGKSDMDRLIDELREARLQNEALLQELRKTRVEQAHKP